MAAAGELEAGVEYVGIATHVSAIEIWPAGHPVTGDMFPPAAGAGVLTLTVRPRETLLWGCSVTENSL